MRKKTPIHNDFDRSSHSTTALANRARHTPRDSHPPLAKAPNQNQIDRQKLVMLPSIAVSSTREGLYSREDMATVGFMVLSVAVVFTAVLGTVYAREAIIQRATLPLIDVSAQTSDTLPAIRSGSPGAVISERGPTSGVIVRSIAPPQSTVGNAVQTQTITTNSKSFAIAAADVSNDRLDLKPARSVDQLNSVIAKNSYAKVQTHREIAQISGIKVSEIESASLPRVRVGALQVVREMSPMIKSQPNQPVTLPTWELEDKPKVCWANTTGLARAEVVGYSDGVASAAETNMASAVGANPIPQSMSNEEFGVRLAEAAAKQLKRFVIYNEVYLPISYPMGDVPSLFGVCTDVVVRAYRDLGIDLQALVHKARVGSGDRSIDHRRTQTLRRFFSKKAQSLPITDFAEDYLPGDIVTYHRPQNSGSQYHIAIVANAIAPSGRPMIIHNRGWGPQIEDGLFVDRITGHYRYRAEPNISPPAPLAPKFAPPPVRRDANLGLRSEISGPSRQ
ncbi:MAG: DUF1287 domain-containing protein [Hyphomicrobiaceae bacterium]